MAVKMNKTIIKSSKKSASSRRYTKILGTAVGCASLLVEARAFSPSCASGLMEPSVFAARRDNHPSTASPSPSTTTTLWFRNGDTQDLTNKQTETHEQAIAPQRSIKLADIPRSSGLIPYLLNRCKKKRDKSEKSLEEDYDLTSYLQYVNKRHERLHLDDEPSPTTKKMVHKNGGADSWNIFPQGSFQPSSTQHSDALYVLSWAGHFAEQIHTPWSNSNVMDVASSELDKSEFEPIVSSTTQYSKRIAVTHSVIARVNSIQTRMLAMQYRVVAKIASHVLNRVRKLTQLIAERGVLRVKFAMSLATVLFLFAVRPVTSAVSKI